VKIPETISDQCAAPINCSLATTMCAMEYVPKIKNGRAFIQVKLFCVVYQMLFVDFFDAKTLPFIHASNLIMGNFYISKHILSI
jgi:hypothetical protein